ncbi:MAG: aspartyl protease family protein [Croceibacterium sp.]
MTWQVVAAGLAVASGVVVTPTITPADVQIDSVAVLSEPSLRMTVPVTIGGKGPFRFLIDTGAQATVLSIDLAQRLQLFDRRSAMLVGAASRRLVETAAVDGIVLGSRNFNVATAPLVTGEYIGGADGILGLDSLQNQRVLLDFKKKIMRVADAKDLGGNRGYEIIVRAQRKLGQLIITRARLDGVGVSVIIDTGAEGSIGNPALLDKLRRMREQGTGEMTDVNGASLTGSIRVARKLSIDLVQIQNLAILFADSPTFHALGLANEPTLILGMEQLRLFNRVAIDFATSRVLFDVPSADSYFTGTNIQPGL